MDESTAITPPQSRPARTRTVITPTSGLERATVKWFNRVHRAHVAFAKPVGLADSPPGVRVGDPVNDR
jgi:hypothetical protein